MKSTSPQHERTARRLGTFFVLLLSLIATSSGCEVHNLKDFILPAFKDKSLSDFLLSTHSQTRKLWMCTVKCRFDTRCRSYQFNNLTHTCSLFGCGFSKPNKTFLPFTEDAGWMLYGMVGRNRSLGHVCTTSGDCAFAGSYCRDGRCECILGSSFDPNTGSCVSHCDVYGDVFQAQSTYAIHGLNRNSFTGMTLEACKQACLDRVDYVCRSFDFDPRDGRCNLSDKTWSDAPDENKYLSTEWSLYTRHCAAR